METEERHITDGIGASSEEEQNVSSQVAKSARIVKKARSVKVIKKATVPVDIQNKIMYGATEREEGNYWELNDFNDSGSDFDLVGAEKAAKDVVRIVTEILQLDVEDVQVNPVKIVGVAEYFVAQTPGGQRVKN